MDARMGSSKVLVRHGGTRRAPHHLLLHRHVADQTQPRTTPPRVPPKEVAQKALRYSISIPFRPLCSKTCSHYRKANTGCCLSDLFRERNNVRPLVPNLDPRGHHGCTCMANDRLLGVTIRSYDQED